jgi:hypothetical protein
MTKLDADIADGKAEVAKYEAQLAAAQTPLAKLMTAREVIESYSGETIAALSNDPVVEWPAAAV